MGRPAKPAWRRRHPRHLARAAAVVLGFCLLVTLDATAPGSPANTTAGAAHAAPAVDTAADPVLEARVAALAAELRCLVCQNQSLADSHADLALDLKQQVREQLRAGRSEAEVVAYMTERYGDFVRYRPPLKGTTLLLWSGPALLVGIGALALWRTLSRRKAGGATTLAPTDLEKADVLLRDES